MQLENVTLTVITVAVLLQAPVNGGLIRVAYKTLKAIVREELRWPWQRKTPKAATVYMYDGCNLCPWGECRPLAKPPDKPEFDLEADVKLLTDTLSMLKSKTYYYFNTSELKDATGLFNVWIRRTAMQKTAITVAYKAKNNVELRDDFAKMRIAPRYEILMKSLVTPLPLFYAEQFSLGMKYQTSSPPTARYGRIIMLEMLTSLPTCLIVKIIDTYNNGNREFFVDLKKSLEIAKMPSDYIYAVESLAKFKQNVLDDITQDDNGIMSWIRAFLDAYRLKKSVKYKPIDVLKYRYSELFTKNAFPDIVKTIEAYEDLKNEKGSFLKDMSQKELGNVGEIYTVMTMILTDKNSYFATIMEQILRKKGVYGLDADINITLFFKSRLDIDLQDIIDAYNKQSKTGVAGDFKVLSDSFQYFQDPLFLPTVTLAIS